MTKEAALYTFFSSLGWAAYPDTEVPECVPFKYITYQVITDSWGGGTVFPTVRMWCKDADANTLLNEKARALSEKIGDEGTLLSCDGGYILVMRGTPWCRNTAAEADNTIKGRYINISLRYLTTN